MVFYRHALWRSNLLFVLHCNQFLKPEWKDQLKHHGEWATRFCISCHFGEHESFLVKPQHIRAILVLLPLQLYIVLFVLLVLQSFPWARYLSVIPTFLRGSSDLLCAGSCRWCSCGFRWRISNDQENEGLLWRNRIIGSWTQATAPRQDWPSQ